MASNVQPMGRGTSPRDLLQRAVLDLPPRFSPGEVTAWFDRHAPGVASALVEGLVISCTVNDPRRRHYPTPRDVLYRRAGGSLEAYVLERHGRWTALGTRAHPSAHLDDAVARAQRLLPPPRGRVLAWLRSA